MKPGDPVRFTSGNKRRAGIVSSVLNNGMVVIDVSSPSATMSISIQATKVEKI